ncbi:bifunctional diaminohydroxyphosphoribosylaminopyrimidine deaminase/5-amino-6-(5-phosphoribosylamino)uracil reductase RibD [Kiritimatiellota bacterium B12222]|nr:bifunctional diaminohydroxyphosphoribosylaminopyrimidine deaminase/5-amino-6-(5-phosphoribosylamino)uracil reductase RibD [Kiritimatiellota bacterium B12222]
MKTKAEAWMQEALAEARKGLGFTAPNPAVGAVVVKDGQIIGRGYHHKAGTPHAEPLAIKDAGAAARGATIVVTLEPCSTTGRMPPCTQAVLAAGIEKVVVGCTDPNPAHAGRGLDILREAGVEVVTGVLETECQDLIRAFAHLQVTGRPYVTLKLATTLDGRIADAQGNSQWISGPASRDRVQALRRSVDAMLVGTETVLRDDPSLMPRPQEGHSPLRIIPDRQGRLPLERKVFSDGHPSCCLLGPDVPDSRLRALEELGVAVLQVHSFSWTEMMKTLGQRGVQHILCEGGGQLAGALLKEDLVQELEWFMAPKILGGAGLPAMGGGWELSEAPEFEPVDHQFFGEDAWMRLRKRADL